MDDTVIRVRGLSKRYLNFATPRGRLLHAFLPGHRGGMQEVWALQGVSFEVARGECVAVIGRNGGGKSTLLQLITGIVQPTSGAVEVNGRVSALLELGSGFNPEYTGRDNVLMNGLLLGLSRDEITLRFGEIEAFAEIGEAIDRPVKTYSSGMVMRLAFAVQVLTRPEILIVDEALSVGDFFFQQKCFAYIRSLCERGVTLLFVSHDMASVRDLCPRALYLKQGRMEYFGPTHVAVGRYLAERSPAATATRAAATPSPAVAGTLPEHALWRHESGDARALLAVEVLGQDGRPTTSVRMGGTIQICVHLRPSGPPPAHLSLVLKNRYGQVVTSTSSYTLGLPALPTDGVPRVFRFDVTMALEAGLYTFMVAFGPATERNQGRIVDDTGWLGPLRVDWDYEHDTAPFLGMFGLPMRAELVGGSGGTQVARAATKGEV